VAHKKFSTRVPGISSVTSFSSSWGPKFWRDLGKASLNLLRNITMKAISGLSEKDVVRGGEACRSLLGVASIGGETSLGGEGFGLSFWRGWKNLRMPSGWR